MDCESGAGVKPGHEPWGRVGFEASVVARTAPIYCREGLGSFTSIQLPGSIQPVRTKYHHGVSFGVTAGYTKIAIGEMDAPRGTIGSAHQDGQPRGRYIDGLRVRSRHFDGTGLGRSLRRPGSSSWCSGHDNRHGHGAGASDALARRHRDNRVRIVATIIKLLRLDYPIAGGYKGAASGAVLFADLRRYTTKGMPT